MEAVIGPQARGNARLGEDGVDQCLIERMREHAYPFLPGGGPWKEK
jgi:hypothetical protein